MHLSAGGGMVAWVDIDDGLTVRNALEGSQFKLQCVLKYNSVFLLQLLRGPGLRGAVHLAGRHHQVADLPPQDGRGAPRADGGRTHRRAHDLRHHREAFTCDIHHEI